MKTGCLPITSFAQYAHLARIRKLAEANPTLQASLDTDYLIRPDITIGIPTNGTLHLHASISCKWTIRSDRVQNIRHEAVVMTKHRRGRQPHIVAVTAEPMPSRLAAIAREQANWIVYIMRPCPNFAEHAAAETKLMFWKNWKHMRGCALSSPCRK